MAQADETLVSFLMSQGMTRARAEQEALHDPAGVKAKKKQAEEEAKPKPED